MRKSDRKIDQQICQILTELCESEFKKIEGFQWVTHTVDYDRWPKSLQVTLMFDNHEHLVQTTKSTQKEHVKLMTQQALKRINIAIKPHQIDFQLER